MDEKNINEIIEDVSEVIKEVNEIVDTAQKTGLFARIKRLINKAIVCFKKLFRKD